MKINQENMGEVLELVEALNLITVIEFTKKHYNGSTKTITLPLKEFKDLDFMLRRYKQPIPELWLQSTTGVKVLFTNPEANSLGVKYKSNAGINLILI